MFHYRIILLILLVACPGYTSAQENFALRLSDAAVELTTHDVDYDPGYYKISYPGGDIPPGRGVCTDVVIRAYRALGIDLQMEVHEDMKLNFDQYPKNWGQKTTDTNIDHRRVPNLAAFFTRQGQVKKISSDPGDYLPGDIVTWDLGRGITHIGIVINKRSQDGKRNLIVHNIGRGQEISDCLFSFRITGHFTYKK